ncbi:MAG: anti-sigma factor family protein [Pirellulales bacterium]
MSESPDNSTVAQELDEQLVAYLDGELVDEQRAEVESRLASDETFRRRLQELDQTWELLSELPVAEVDEENFTRSTVEMIAVAASQEVEAYQEDTRKKNWLQYTGAFFLGVVACYVGFLLIHQLTSASNQQLLTDLPVIESIDEYQRVEDIDFLELLEQEGLFAEEVESEM